MKPLLKPARLRRGDLIGVAALSGPVEADALQAGCAELRRLGYGVRPASNVNRRSGVLGLAGEDEERLAGYRQLLLDPEVKAILFARGGYGVQRILPRLDPTEVALHPKIHCGFSDVTALSGFLLRRCGIPSFHGPMVAADLAAGLEPLSARFFPSMLEGSGPSEVLFPRPDVLVPGGMSGPLMGGCLSLLASSVGTPDEFLFDGSVVFFEEAREEAYRLDRMLGTLLAAGRFDRLAGVLVGSLSLITFGGREDPDRLRQLLLERLSPLGVPVVAGLPSGHSGPNVALPVGARAVWDPAGAALRFPEEIVT